MYQRKTKDEYRIHVNYGQGWEHEATEASWKDARAQVRCYRENINFPVKYTGPHRVKKEWLCECGKLLPERHLLFCGFCKGLENAS